MGSSDQEQGPLDCTRRKFLGTSGCVLTAAALGEPLHSRLEASASPGPKRPTGSFHLRINFTGLCLFVPYGGAMYVLMPQTNGSHSAQVLVKNANGTGWNAQATLAQGLVDLRKLPVQSAGADTRLPHVADLMRVPGVARVPASWLEKPPVANAQSVIAMGAGCVTEYDPGRYWAYLAGQPYNDWMTWSLDWFIPNVQQDALDGSLFTGTTPQTFVPNGNLIDIQISHLPAAGVPADIQHFTCFGKLAAGFNGVPSGSSKKTEPNHYPPCSPPILKNVPRSGPSRGDTMTCMVAQASAQ